MTRSLSRTAAALAALALAAAIMAGCGSSNSNTTSAPASTGGAASTSSTGSTGADQKVASEVPASVKSKGTLTVAADATYAPNEFIGSNGKTVEGMDAD